MWGEFCDIYSPLAEEKKEINLFVKRLNSDIQRLDLDKDEVIRIVENLYRQQINIKNNLKLLFVMLEGK